MFITGIRLDELGADTHGPDAYLHTIPVVRQLLDIRRLDLTTPITFIVGENGSGKSTLVEAIAIAMRYNPEGGSTALRFSSESTESELHKWLTVIRAKNPKHGFFLRSESLYNVATILNELAKDPVEPPRNHVDLHRMSHGEAMMHVANERFDQPGLFILDEPESGLSPLRQMALLIRIFRAAQRGSQFIIATHSPILLGIPDCTILEIDNNGLHHTTFDTCTTVQAAREFFDDPDGVVEFLLSEEEDESDDESGG